MRRVLALFTLFALALWGQSLLRAAAEQTYALRDGLLLIAGAALLFALLAPRPPAPALLPVTFWPFSGWFLVTAGLACSLLAGLGALGLAQLSTSLDLRLLVAALWMTGIGLCALGTLWPAVPIRYPLPSYRWSRDAAGRLVRLALDPAGLGTAAQQRERLPPHVWSIGLLLVLGGGAALRLWQAATVPSGCRLSECTLALDLIQWATAPTAPAVPAGSTPLLSYAAAVALRLGGAQLTSLRLLTALLGAATLPLFYAFSRRLTRPATALLATALLAMAAWPIWFSRTLDPLSLVPLLFCLYGLLATRAQAAPTPARWALAGLALGLLAAEAVPLRPWIVAWGTFHLLLVMAALRPAAKAFLPLPAFAAGLLTGLLPALALGSGAAAGIGPPQTGEPLLGWVSALLQPLSASDLPVIATYPLLDPLTATASILGCAVALRHLRHTPGLVGLGVLFLGTAVWFSPGPAVERLLPLLPLIWAAAALGLEGLWGPLVRVWSPLVRPGWILAAVGTLIGLLLVGQAIQLNRRLTADPALYAAQNLAHAAVGAYLAAGDNSASTTYLVWEPLLNHPAARLAVAAAAHPPPLRALAPTLGDIPYTGPVVNDLIYLLPTEASDALSRLRQLYPAGRFTPHQDRASGQTQFVTYTVSRQLLADSQGLRGRYYTGLDFGAGAPPAYLAQDGPLRFAWGTEPPLIPPFSAIWEGSLLIRSHGRYTFQIAGGGTGASGTSRAEPVLSLQLDNTLLLDSSLGLREQTVELAEGFYRVDMAYRSGEQPQDLTITWHRPPGLQEPVPRQALYGLSIPNSGLLGTYRAVGGAAPPTTGGAVLTRRKEPLPMPAPDLSPPYHVTWQGKLAAPVAGSYLFTLTADGDGELRIGDQSVLTMRAGSSIRFAQGGLSLTAGWHDVTLIYQPGPGPHLLELGWQPPGHVYGPITSSYLAPLLPTAPTGDLPLPALPILPVTPRTPPTAPGLGRENSASATAAPLLRADLPILPLDVAWQVGACGDADDLFRQPRGVAVDARAGRIYVADPGSQRVVIRRLDDGSLAGSYRTPTFVEPFDVAVAATGDLFVLDAVAHLILRVAALSGQPQIVATAADFYRPRGLGLDLSGRLFVADTGGARIVILEPDGQLLAELGGVDSPLGQGQPVDVLPTPDAIWAVTAEDGLLWRLDTGTTVGAVTPGNTLDGPHLAGLSDGSFWLTDPQGGGVIYLSAEGRPLGRLDVPGTLLVPVGIGAAEDGDQVSVAVSDSLNCRITLWQGSRARLTEAVTTR